MEYKDYYKILSVAKNASTKEIKKAYRKLALRYHPDKNPGDKSAEHKFHEINEANQVLSDTEKRKKYDELGHDWQNYQQSGDNKNSGFNWSKYSQQDAGFKGDTEFHFSSNLGEDIPDEFFEMLFGRQSRGNGGRKRSLRGNDAMVEAPITLDEAYHGSSRLVEINGQKIKVNIKPGTADQQLLRIAGKGTPGLNGGPSGDLLIKVNILPHGFFQRRLNDLHLTVPVDLYTSLLGGTTRIKTFKGAVNLNIPAETSNRQVFKMRGLGMPLFGVSNRYGDLYAKVDIQIPKKLNDEERGLFQKLQKVQTEQRS